MHAYRALLRLFPASFQTEYSEEMCAVFAARRQRENAFLLWIATILDIFISATRVHADLLRQDLRWTLRNLRQSIGFTATAVIVIALGIGATTAAFTLLDHVLLRPLPYPHPGQLVTLFQTDVPHANPRIAATPPNFLDWRAMNKSFVSMGAYVGILAPMNLSGQGEPIRLDTSVISHDVFETLGVRPAVGRTFRAEDDQRGIAPTAILSDGTASALFGSASKALGQTVFLDNGAYVIIGVMPPGFAFPFRTVNLWLPLKAWENRQNRMLGVVARLRDGVSLAQARAELNVIGRQLEQAYPADNKGLGIGAVETRTDMSPQSRALVIAVFAASFCLLLIACTNLANLLFARAMTRRHEIAVRVAIGAARERLVRQLLTENTVVAIIGGVFGLLLAILVTPALGILVPGALPIGATPEIDWRVFAFATALTLGASFAFGVGPALRSTNIADVNALRSRSTASGRTDRLRSALVLAEVASSVTLLVGAGLLLKAMWRVQAVHPGFRAEGVLSLRTAVPPATMPAQYGQFYDRVLSAARALPGVESAGYVSFLPMTAAFGNFPVSVPGVTTPAHMRLVTPDYFKTMRIPLLRGRDISEADTREAPQVTVISQSLANVLWPGQDPIGRQMSMGTNWTVVGVVGDVAVRGLEQSPLPQDYFSAKQIPRGLGFYAPKDLVVRVSNEKSDPLTLVPALRQIIRSANPEQAISDVQLVEQIVDSQTEGRRAQLRVLGVFAGIAFLLAAVGIHGLLSFAVSSRTREVGVRVALGARRSDILSMFLRQGGLLGLGGIAIAIPLAYAAARSMTTLLFGVQPGDPWIYLAAASLALIMTIAGSLRPSLRAASTDPAIAIRAE